MLETVITSTPRPSTPSRPRRLTSRTAPAMPPAIEPLSNADDHANNPIPTTAYPRFKTFSFNLPRNRSSSAVSSSSTSSTSSARSSRALSPSPLHESDSEPAVTSAKSTTAAASSSSSTYSREKESGYDHERAFFLGTGGKEGNDEWESQEKAHLRSPLRSPLVLGMEGKGDYI